MAAPAPTTEIVMGMLDRIIERDRARHAAALIEIGRRGSFAVATELVRLRLENASLRNQLAEAKERASC